MAVPDTVTYAGLVVHADGSLSTLFLVDDEQTRYRSRLQHYSADGDSLWREEHTWQDPDPVTEMTKGRMLLDRDDNLVLIEEYGARTTSNRLLLAGYSPS